LTLQRQHPQIGHFVVVPLPIQGRKLVAVVVIAVVVAVVVVVMVVVVMRGKWSALAI